MDGYNREEIMLKIFPVETSEDLEIARSLLGEYLVSRENHKSIFCQELKAFQKQLANLPAEFAGPRGCLLFARYEERSVGCVGLRDLGDDICEMKRLYVKPEWRGWRIGKGLAKEVIEKAKTIGYSCMRIDTFDNAAKALYASLGFKEIEPYRYNPIEGVVFMELKLM
jgi:N-acetylglutamate synthase-like GNAT family acetyltransferase